LPVTQFCENPPVNKLTNGGVNSTVCVTVSLYGCR